MIVEFPARRWKQRTFLHTKEHMKTVFGNHVNINK